MTQIFFLFIFL